MQIKYSNLNDLKKIKKFVIKFLNKSILSNTLFLKYNFQDKKKVNTLLFLKNNKIISINFFIPRYCLYKKKKIKFVWSSALYSNNDGEKFGAAFQLMAKLHNSFPLVGSLCPNKHTLKYNDYFGMLINTTIVMTVIILIIIIIIIIITILLLILLLLLLLRRQGLQQGNPNPCLEPCTPDSNHQP